MTTLILAVLLLLAMTTAVLLRNRSQFRRDNDVEFAGATDEWADELAEMVEETESDKGDTWTRAATDATDAEALALAKAEQRRMRLERAGRAWCEETLDAVRAGRLPFTAPPRPAWHLLYPSPPSQPDPDHGTPRRGARGSGWGGPSEAVPVASAEVGQVTAVMALADPRHWPASDQRFEVLLLALLNASTSMERMLAVGPLLEAGFGDEWLVDDACGGRSVQLHRFAGHVVRTETAYQQRTLAESGLAVPLHTADRVRYITPQQMASRNWWSQLDMTEGAS